MLRRLALVGALLVFLIGLTAWHSGLQAGDKQKSLTIKLLLPAADAKVKVDKAKIKGEGEERTLKVTAKGDSITISAMWEPNNYTKITRTRKLSVKDLSAKDKADLVVDLRKDDPKQPDAIVVRFVPTPDDVVEGMCKLAKVGKDDVVYDLGCGDGRMVITAVKKFSAKRGVGVDLDEDKETPNLIQKCKEKAKEAGLTEMQIEFRKGDVLKVKDLSDASVVLLYMGDDINNRLRPILQKTLKPGSRVVSHRFLMGDWKPDKTETVNSTAGYPCEIHLWTIKGGDKK